MTTIFKQTSEEPYDRHDYEVFLKNNKKIFFDNWEDTLNYWWTNCQIPDFLDYIVVKDKKKVKTKGFAQ
jgi:hypothetical protein